MKRFVYIFFLAAVLSVWMPGVGAHVSDEWRQQTLTDYRDFQQIDAELGTQKTLVPGVESQWIICRNDPVNFVDPDGRDFYYLMDKDTLFGIGHSAVLTGPVDGKYRYDSYGKYLFKNPRQGVYYFNSLDDAMIWISDHGYDEFIMWATTEEEDKKVQEAADEIHKGNGKNYKRLKKYGLLNFNCDAFVNALAMYVPSVMISDRALIRVPHLVFGDTRHMGLQYKDVFRYLADKEIGAYRDGY